MTSFNDAVKAISDFKGQFQMATPSWVAYLGDGNGTVQGSSPIHVYVRYPSVNSPAVEIINTRVTTQIQNVKVKVGYLPEQPNILQVLSVVPDQRLDSSTSLAFIPPHGNTHAWGGSDPTYIAWRQIADFRLYAQGTLQVTMQGGIATIAGVINTITTQPIDLSLSVPSSAGARWSLISLDSTGAVVVTDGSIQTNAAALNNTHIPATPSGNWRIWAIKLQYGQTTIDETRLITDTLDLRWPQNTGTGSIAVSDIALTTNHVIVGNASNVGADVAMSGDATIVASGALTLASVITAGGPVGDATHVPQITYDAKGRLTLVNSVAITGVSPVGAALTRGSLFRGSAANLIEAYALGAANKVLQSDGTDAVWSTNTLTISGNSTINGSLVGNITGGGTLATGGFTLTVPESLTSAGRNVANTFTALQTITITDATTNTESNIAVINHNSSNTTAAGFGSTLRFNLKFNNANDTAASGITTYWSGTSISRVRIDADSGTGSLSEALTVGTNYFKALSAAPIFGAYTLTIPETLTAAGRDVANTFTLNQTISKDVPALLLYTTSANSNARNWSVQSNYSAYGDFAIVQSNALGGNPQTAGTPRFYVSYQGSVGFGTTNTVIGDGTYFASLTANSTGALGTGSFYYLRTDAAENRSGLWIKSGTTTAGWLSGVMIGGGFKIGYGNGANETASLTNAILISTSGFELSTAGIWTQMLNNATTNAVDYHLIEHRNSGTSAAGFGIGLKFQLQSTTTFAQDAGAVSIVWNDATHATRKADVVLYAYDTAAREFMRGRGSGSAAALGFLGATPITQPANTVAINDVLVNFGLRASGGESNFSTRTTYPGTYAAIHVHDASTAQNVATGTTYVKITAFTDNGFSNNCTPDAANDKITITKAGLYRVVGSVSFSDDTNNVTWFASVFLNGTEQDQIHFTQKIGTAGDVGNAALTGIIDVTTVPWDLDLRMRHDAAGTVAITVSYANLNIEYVGET